MRERAASPAPDVRRCRVECTARGAEWSVRFGPGSLVDLDAPLTGALRVRDVVDPAWFDPIDPEPDATHPALAMEADGSWP